MKSVHLVLLGVVAFLMACGQTNPESSPVQVQTEPTQASPDKTEPDQTSPDQADTNLSAQGLVWNVVAVDASGYGGGEVSMVLDANSRPVISYSSTSGDLKLVRCGNPTCSSGNLIQKVDGIVNKYDNWSGRFNSLVLDASGRPVISYSTFDTYATGTLKLVHCGNANCSSGNIFQNLRNSYPGPDHSSLVLDAAGNPVISFEIADQNFVVYHCNDVNCATRNEYLPLAQFIGDTSLALDARGYPVIGYVKQNLANPSLRLVHCGNANCTSNNTTRVVDNGSIEANAPSLVLDSAGRPVMGYYDAINKDLRVVHCGDANCSSGNLIKVVDSAGDVGNSPSMKLAAGGKPVIAHGNASNGTLKLVNCGDVNCINGNVSQVVGFVGAGYATKSSLALDGSGKPVIAYGTSSGQLRLARTFDNSITPPTVTPNLGGTLGTNGWYTGNVTLGWTLNNNGSVITISSGCETVTINTDGPKTITCSATNGGGTTSQSVSFKRDATKPRLSPTVSSNPVLQYLSATGTPNASDASSGVASQECPTPNTGTPGVFFFACTATDLAGNKGTNTVSYTVISASQGIQNLTARVNSLRIGNPGIKNQLTSLLAAANRSLASGSKPAALTFLSRFMNVVRTSTGLPFGQGIGRGDADFLIYSATKLVASINAGP
jgi:hypothetical protein